METAGFGHDFGWSRRLGSMQAAKLEEFHEQSLDDTGKAHDKG
jgi:hypothetical protein